VRHAVLVGLGALALCAGGCGGGGSKAPPTTPVVPGSGVAIRAVTTVPLPAQRIAIRVRGAGFRPGDILALGHANTTLEFSDPNVLTARLIVLRAALYRFDPATYDVSVLRKGADGKIGPVATCAGCVRIGQG
jgi:hypothetical protein